MDAAATPERRTTTTTTTSVTVRDRVRGVLTLLRDDREMVKHGEKGGGEGGSPPLLPTPTTSTAIMSTIPTLRRLPHLVVVERGGGGGATGGSPTTKDGVEVVHLSSPLMPSTPRHTGDGGETTGRARLHEWLHCWWWAAVLPASSSCCGAAPLSPTPPPAPLHQRSRSSSRGLPSAHDVDSKEKADGGGAVVVMGRNTKNSHAETKEMREGPRNEMRWYFFGTTWEEEEEWSTHVWTHVFGDGDVLPTRDRRSKKKEEEEQESKEEVPHEPAAVVQPTRRWHTSNRYFSAEVWVEARLGALGKPPLLSSAAQKDGKEAEEEEEEDRRSSSFHHPNEDEDAPTGMVVFTSFAYLRQAAAYCSYPREVKPISSCSSLSHGEEKEEEEKSQASDANAAHVLAPPPPHTTTAERDDSLSPCLFVSFSSFLPTMQALLFHTPTRMVGTNATKKKEKEMEKEAERECSGETYEDEEEDPLRILYVMDRCRTADGAEEEEVEHYVDMLAEFLSSSLFSRRSLVEVVFSDPPHRTISAARTTAAAAAAGVACSVHENVIQEEKEEETDGCLRLREAMEQHVWPVVHPHRPEENARDEEEKSSFSHPPATPSLLVSSCALPPHFLVHPDSLKSIAVRALRILLPPHSLVACYREETEAFVSETMDTKARDARESTTKKQTHPHPIGTDDLQKRKKNEDDRSSTSTEKKKDGEEEEEEAHTLPPLSPRTYAAVETELLHWMQEMKHEGKALPFLVRRQQAEVLAMAFEQLLKRSPAKTKS